MTFSLGKILPLSLPLLAPFAALAQAADERFDLGGHEVLLRATEDFTSAVIMGGETLHEDAQVLLDPVLDLAGTPVLSGLSGAGGNACSAAPFVLALKNGQPELDGPVETCTYLERSIEGDALVYSNTPLPGVPSEVWRWTVAGGWSQEDGQEFQPLAGETWADSAVLAGKHPIEALGFAPVYAIFKQGMSPVDFAAYTNALAEMGSGDLGALGYQGEACWQVDCEGVWARLWIDPATKTAVAIWQAAEDDAPRFFPEAAETWPAWIQDAAQSVLAFD
ncbi:hypothetical protein Q9295_05690 [Xinfangfangia sp. CPCC 101601]|uniref:Uncharacterized protein n=1 Tax=Pseudogemmobacter lacusdianii TaxID=3069608 RepID=A0ABU0VVT1_9RHOB|nr:hypothetical protein [Xinfangfangia sp. CPCC 101601]MDQ2065854.1 hypothetical protein [Xinfangfangia sp. CPCC 101601]